MSEIAIISGVGPEQGMGAQLAQPFERRGWSFELDVRTAVEDW